MQKNSLARNTSFSSVFRGLECLDKCFEESQRGHNRLHSVPWGVLSDIVCLKALQHCNLLCFSTFGTFTPHPHHASHRGVLY